MIGIVSYGAYIPRMRLPASVMAGKAPKEGGPEKAVAWMDEDSVTMAVAAAQNCLQGFDRSRVDAVLFATTTYAFAEKQGAAIIAKALNLKGDVRTADISHSTRSGSIALQSAVDAVKAGSAARVLVIAADCRMGAPGSGFEANTGDAAAAFLVGAEGAIASLDCACAHTTEIIDIWRKQGDRFVHSWEDRFVNVHGYIDNTVAAIKGLFAKSGKTAADIAKAALYAPEARSLGEMSKAAGIAKEQIQDTLFGKVGNAGSAYAPLLLIAALENAKAGEKILVANYGDGADAMLFTVTGARNKAEGYRSVNDLLAHRKVVDAYGKYMKARGLTITEYPENDDQGISATVHYRERDEDLSLEGQQCTHCGTHQFPKGRVCVRCHAKDLWTPSCYSDLTGKVVTYTLDAFFPSPEPPTAVGIIEVVNADGSAGPRIHMQIGETTPKDIAIDLPVEFTFRCIHRVGLRPNYFWKCTPIATAVAEGAAA
ncbi:MAG TPA: zinc ribbon domain-containing protein [Pseudomonadales bacterium]|nr:zinc ribbon domain-containing protein [Pseudomonadales bacterium]